MSAFRVQPRVSVTAVRSALLVGPLLTATLAHAEEKTIHGTLSGDVSATDNVFSVSGENGGNRESDIYGQIRPGLLFGYATPRSTYEGLLQGEILNYLLRDGEPTFTFRAATRAQWVTGKSSELSLTAGGSTGRLNAIGNRTSPDQTAIGVSLPGAVKILSGEVGQGFGYTFENTMRFSEQLSGQWMQTEDPNSGAETRAGTVALGLGLERSWESNSLGLAAGVGFTRLLQYQPPRDGIMEVGQLEYAFVPQATLTWRHDINQTWSGGITGGAGYVIPVGDDPYQIVEPKKVPTFTPLASGQLSYTDTWGFANLGLGRSLTPNLLIAQNTINDGITATVNVPLAFIDRAYGRPPQWVASGNAGFIRTSLIESRTGAEQGTFYVTRFDLGVSYSPRPNATFAARYALTVQTTGDEGSMQMAIGSFYVNTFTFTFGMRYPDTNPVTGRRDRSVRADRSDVTEDNPIMEDDKLIGGNARPGAGPGAP